ncbi:MAG TPA: phosphoribosylformylglycinamidine synthase subunit PurQ [Pseudonocardia sp.]
MSRIGVITFPGTLDDVDAARAVRLAGDEDVPLWHADHDLRGVDAVIVPGGFSYGDYLRAGAIASLAPIMTEVVAAVGRGMPVLGICNGFQILCEAGLLPGALVRNTGLHFVCRDQRLRIEANTAWTADLEGREILVPVKNMDGRYVADAATLADLEDNGRVVFRYVGGNPNGSVADIAGISSADGRVVGLMPHPEHAVDALTGPSTDGLALFTSLRRAPTTA